MDGLEQLRPERPQQRERGAGPGGPKVSGHPGTRQHPAARGWTEQPLVIPGSQGPMIGVLVAPVAGCRSAVLIVAGQPQTRVGAHRMFTELARGLGDRGIASLRFDVGGWGDSPGEARAFERSDRDIAIAAAALRAACPPSTRLWLWGLCDGASAAVLALPALKDAGVIPDAMCLVNPWVRSEASLADAMVKTYYLKRLVQGEFWGRLLRGKVPLDNLVREPLRHLKAKFGAAAPVRTPTRGEISTPRGPSSEPGSGSHSGPAPQPDLPSQLLACLSGYRGEVCTVLSGNDLTAAETDALMARDKRWRRRLDRKGALLRVQDADHTFSTPEHWARVIDWVAGAAQR